MKEYLFAENRFLNTKDNLHVTLTSFLSACLRRISVVIFKYLIEMILYLRWMSQRLYSYHRHPSICLKSICNHTGEVRYVEKRRLTSFFQGLIFITLQDCRRVYYLIYQICLSWYMLKCFYTDYCFVTGSILLKEVIFERHAKAIDCLSNQLSA